MAIGIVSDDQLEDELIRLGIKDLPKTTGPIIVESPSKGRKEGDNNVPDSLRKIIGETSVIEGRRAALDLASDFGISASSVSAYAKGATSTTSYNNPSQSIISHINKSRKRAIKRASTTLNQALESITQDKLDYADAKDLSTIAKDMSVVIKNLEPSKDQPAANEVSQPQFIIYAPQFKKEESFDVIHVQE